MMKTLHEQISGRCAHFNGIQHQACEKGMVYDEVDADLRLPYRVGLPCHKPDPKALERLAGHPQCFCPHVQFPTEAEVQTEIDEINEQTRKMMVVGEVLAPIREACKGKGGQGTLECPVCQGALHWRISSYNGHAQVNCETEGCARWIE